MRKQEQADMISKTEMAESLTQFQKVHTLNSGTLGLVGRNWWQGFKKRHASQIALKKGENFASNRAVWTKLSNITQMYECIYNEMIDAHIDSPCANPVYTDREGIEVEESERFGCSKKWGLTIQITFYLQIKVGVK